MSLVLALAVPVRGAVRRVRCEVAAFGAVGALAFAVDNGGYTLLVFGLHGPGGGPMASTPVAASVLATAVATLVSWLGNRYWTYRRQRRGNLAHELVLFLAVNLAGMAITAGAVAFSREVLGLHSVLTDNASRLGGWGVATALRFVGYRRLVFVASSS